jgi:hypothetical protein
MAAAQPERPQGTYEGILHDSQLEEETLVLYRRPHDGDGILLTSVEGTPVCMLVRVYQCNVWRWHRVLFDVLRGYNFGTCARVSPYVAAS